MLLHWSILHDILCIFYGYAIRERKCDPTRTVTIVVAYTGGKHLHVYFIQSFYLISAETVMKLS